MSASALDDRSRDVLKSLIRLHIATGQPVGSQNLSRILETSLSPASIRNIMADLERQGYLAHPHTSAGRVPTDEGYRHYVDSLMEVPRVPPLEAAALAADLRPRDGSPSQALENASHVLSRLSRSVGFVLAPDLGRASFMHIDFVRLPPHRILVVMVSSSGLVTHKVVEVEEDIAPDELQACANYLNAHFTGMALDAIRGRLLDLMQEDKSLYDTLLKNVIALGQRVFAGEGGPGRVFLDGTSHFLGQPEFEDLDRMRALFETFEEKGRLVRILNACLSGHGVRITIGHENPDPELRDLAVVTSSYEVDGQAGWGLGVMGSTRMEYERVVGLVDQVARALCLVLKEIRA